MIFTEHLTKQYRTHQHVTTAVKAVSLQIPEGEVYCLLGGNGAGKSTLIHLLMGFVQPTSGHAEINGIQVKKGTRQHLRHITYIPDQVNLYPDLSGFENLEYFVSLSDPGLSRKKDSLRDALVEAGLDSESHHRPSREYSKGMRQKVGIALSIVKGSNILILDEPTTGLDPISANEFSDLITRRARKASTTILMVTHDLFRARKIADRIGIMKQGSLIFESVSTELAHDSLEGIYLAQMGEQTHGSEK
jgi:ABC-2 type transport system ATP-binding protein